MEGCPEGEHLRFKARVRGWKTEAREKRCQRLLGITTEHNLRRALLDAQWKDVLLVPQAWYPEHTPKYETKGWWYVPAEEVLGRTCKTCKAFCELTDFIGTKRRRTGSVNCLKCEPPGGRTGTHSKRGNTKAAPRSDSQSDNDDDGRDKQFLYGVKLRAAEPRYLASGDDGNRGDILLTMAQVKELITAKLHSEEEVATVWLTTSEMGFSLTDEPNTVLCPKDVREGKVCDRYLAPAISEFVTSTLVKTEIGAGMDQQVSDVWRELVSLHRRWGKVNKRTEGDNLRA
jgi:hypothetical protein